MNSWNFLNKYRNRITFSYDSFLFIVVISGIFTAFHMNFMGRSLWCDELLFATSYINRSLSNLTSSILENNQTAPVVFLYLSKIITTCRGNDEAALRTISVISYVLTLILVYIFSKKCLKFRHPLLPSAVLANMWIFLRYSDVFKPYMSESTWVIGLYVVYDRYIGFHDETSDGYWWKYALCSLYFVVCPLAANPCCFFIGGILIVTIIESFVNKKWQKFWWSVITGGCSLISFIINFMVWLRPVSENDYMQSFWDGRAFIILIRSYDDIRRDFLLSYNILCEFKRGFGENKFAYIFWVIFVVGGLLVTLCYSVKEKNKAIISMFIGFGLCLVASSVHMFPMMERMWMFSYPLITLLIINGIEAVSNGKNGIYIIVCGLMLILANNGIISLNTKENVYWEQEEWIPLMNYVEENFTQGESVYSYMPLCFTYWEQTGRSNPMVLNEESTVISTADINEDAKLISQRERCWIIGNTLYEPDRQVLIEQLASCGEVVTIMEVKDTPLYLFIKNN